MPPAQPQCLAEAVCDSGVGSLDQWCQSIRSRVAQTERSALPAQDRWTLPVSSRRLVPKSRFPGAMETDLVDWQGRQIVQSPLKLDDSLP